MPKNDHRRPRAATCEDWDETTQTTLADSRTEANVSAKIAVPELTTKASYERKRRDGSDSGYSSKAATVASDLSGSRQWAMPQAGAALVERERQPYSMSKTRPEQSGPTAGRRRSEAEEPEKPKRVQHLDGTCEICNRYGWHVETGRETSTSSSRTSKPSSPKISRASGQRATSDSQAPPMTKRPSVSARPRPLTMYDIPLAMGQHHATIIPAQVSYAAPMGPPAGWSTPSTPIVQYSPITYSQPFGAVPLTAQPYLEHVPTYFEHPRAFVPEIRPPKPTRRMSSYGDPVIKQKSRSRSPEKFSTSRDDRMRTSALKGGRSEDLDRIIMPPPPRPSPAEMVPGRPGLKKSVTYAPGTSSSASSNRRSIVLDEEITPIISSTSASQTRRTSPSHPPTSYRGPSFSEADRERPVLPSKSASYTSTAQAMRTSSNSVPVPQHVSQTSLPRRPAPLSTQATSTAMIAPPDASPVRERHEVEAEAYQAAASKPRRSLTSDELTAEALALRKQANAKRSVSERSETGSSLSHRSRGSGSGRSSGDGGRSKGRTNSTTRNSLILNVDGVNMVIPTVNEDGKEMRSIKVTTTGKNGGGVSIDFGNGESRTVRSESRSRRGDHETEQEPQLKRIERAPSVTSRVSERSATSSQSGHGLAGSKGKDRERERDMQTLAMTNSRRMSYGGHGQDVRYSRRDWQENERPRDRREEEEDADFDRRPRESSTTPHRRHRDSSSRPRPPLDRPTREELLWREEEGDYHHRSQKYTPRPTPSQYYYDDDDDSDENDFEPPPPPPTRENTVIRRYSVRDVPRSHSHSRTRSRSQSMRRQIE